MSRKQSIRNFLVVLSISIVASVVLYGIDNLNWAPTPSPKTEPVSVTGNAELVYQFGGSGRDGLSWETAIIIENYDVDLWYGENSHGIRLQNVNYFTIIRNNALHKHSYHSDDLYGIYLYNCHNIRIINCYILEFTAGIYLKYCTNITVLDSSLDDNDENGILVEDTKNITLSNNEIMRNLYGMSLLQVNDSIIDDNQIHDNTYNDISMRYSYSNNFTNNVMGQSGIKIYKIDAGYSDPRDYNISIDLTNTVNGKPVYFYQDVTDLDITFNQRIGQLILLNCTNSTFKNGIIDKAGHAMQIYLSKNNTIQNFTISNTRLSGAFLIDSTNNTIRNCTFNINQDTGIYIGNSDNSTIQYTNILTTIQEGIVIDHSSNCRIYNNTIDIVPKVPDEDYFYDSYGVYIKYSHKNYLESNHIDYKSDYCFSFKYSNNNTVKWNTLIGNGTALAFSSAEDNNFTYNEFLDCEITSYMVNNNIDTTNTLNGKKIYYIQSTHNIDFEEIVDISTLLLYNCFNVTIQSLEFDNTGINAIYLLDCGNVTIQGIDLQNIGDAITIVGSDNITVKNCQISNVKRGIYTYSSSNITTTGNRLQNDNQIGIGIYIYYTDNCLVSNNTFTSFNIALKLSSMDNSLITNNSISEASRYGIYLLYSNGNNLTKNIITESLVGFYFYYFDNSIVKFNNMTNVITCILQEYSWGSNIIEDNTCIYVRREAPEWGIFEIGMILGISTALIIGLIYIIFLMIHRYEVKLDQSMPHNAKRNTGEVEA